MCIETKGIDPKNSKFHLKKLLSNFFVNRLYSRKSFSTSGRCPFFTFWEACRKFIVPSRKISKNTFFFLHAFQNAKYEHPPFILKLFGSTIDLQQKIIVKNTIFPLLQYNHLAAFRQFVSRNCKIKLPDFAITRL